jgi:hypothetical protein
MNTFFQNLTLGQLFRYGFAGFALLLCMSLFFPEKVTEIHKSLGDVLAIVLAFAVGGAIHVICRSIYDFHWLHSLHRAVVCETHRCKPPVTPDPTASTHALGPCISVPLHSR